MKLIGTNFLFNFNKCTIHVFVFFEVRKKSVSDNIWLIVNWVICRSNTKEIINRMIDFETKANGFLKFFIVISNVIYTKSHWFIYLI